MHIALDLQACQSESRYRGIGRYSLSLALSLIELAKLRQHRVSIILNKDLDNGSPDLLRELSKYLDPKAIYFFKIPTPSAAGAINNRWRLMASELLREYFVTRLHPDYLHIGTLIADGWSDNCVASVGQYFHQVPTALTHYDLIPLVMHNDYLRDPFYRERYLRRLESLRNSDLLLAISNYSRLEAISLLGKNPDSVVNISSAVDLNFCELKIDASEILKKFGITEGFLLYAPGGFDPRKNIDRLIEAYSGLPLELRRKHKLVIASKLYEGVMEHWLRFASDFGVADDELIFTDYITDDQLKTLYRNCRAYILPSLHEGFGLPALEAMQCGAAVVGSNLSGITEAIGLKEALFNPYSVDEIRMKLEQVCSNNNFVDLLISHARRHSKQFSWENTARLALDSMENDFSRLCENQSNSGRLQPCSLDQIKCMLEAPVDGVRPSSFDWAQLEEAFIFNEMQLT